MQAKGTHGSVFFVLGLGVAVIAAATGFMAFLAQGVPHQGLGGGDLSSLFWTVTALAVLGGITAAVYGLYTWSAGAPAAHSAESVTLDAGHLANQFGPPAQAGLNPWEAVSSVARKYADFSGRASRSEYWWTMLAMLLASVAMEFVPSEVLQMVTGLALLLPNFTVAARRLHDVNFSGWWQLLFLAPAAAAVAVASDPITDAPWLWVLAPVSWAAVLFLLGLLLSPPRSQKRLP